MLCCAASAGVRPLACDGTPRTRAQLVRTHNVTDQVVLALAVAPDSDSFFASADTIITRWSLEGEEVRSHAPRTPGPPHTASTRACVCHVCERRGS